MAKPVVPVQVQLSPADLTKINQMLVACAAGDHECQRAAAAGMPVDDVAAVYRQLADQLGKVKRVYFPHEP